MIRDLITAITSYLDALGNNIYVSIHECSGELYYYMSEFSKYNVHKNPFCQLMKSNDAVWTECVMRQQKIVKKCKNGAFYGMCFCGVEEFVVPVRFKDRIAGYVCVGGFRSDTQKGEKRVEKIAQIYGLNTKQALAVYKDSLDPVKPMPDTVLPNVYALAYMLELLCIKHVELNGLSLNDIRDENFVYGHILVFLQRNFRKKIYLEELSAKCCCSRSYISHMFKRRSGHSISDYVNRLRIEEAEKILCETSLPITEIAHKTGFSDSNYFANIFKKYHGTTPTQYRRKTAESICNSYKNL